MSQRKISRRLSRPQKTINRILRGFYQENRLGDAPHQRRPKKTTEEEDALIIAAVVKDPFSTTKKIKEDLGLPLSISAIRRRLRAADLKSHVVARKPLLTSEHRRKYLDFVRQHEHWRAADWQQVIFSDELTFTSCWCDFVFGESVAAVRYEHENIRSVGASGRVSVNVWGAITYAGLGPLFRIPGRLTAEVYDEITDDVLLPFAINGPFPGGCFYFQHDGSPVHNIDELGVENKPGSLDANATLEKFKSHVAPQEDANNTINYLFTRKPLYVKETGEEPEDKYIYYGTFETFCSTMKSAVVVHHLAMNDSTNAVGATAWMFGLTGYDSVEMDFFTLLWVFQ
ncbi:hypothetical protein MRX96_059150 [Rhipicephalus microplus]